MRRWAYVEASIIGARSPPERVDNEPNKFPMCPDMRWILINAMMTSIPTLEPLLGEWANENSLLSRPG